MEIWNHYEGYSKARASVLENSVEEDLELIDALYGRDNIPYKATPAEVKAEALRQMEIDWRSERNEKAEFHVLIAEHMK
jgi:hypothetical protein